MRFTFPVVLIIAGIAFCGVTSIILFRFDKKKISSSRILAAYLLILAYCLFLVFSVLTGYMGKLPFTLRTGILAFYIFSPLAYLYVKQIVKPSRFQKNDLLCFLPALFYLVDYTPFFLKPVSEKLDILKIYLHQPGLFFSHNDGWLTPNWFHEIFRNLTSLFFSILSLLLLLRVYRIKQREFYSENRNALRWLVFFVIAQFFFVLPYIGMVLMHKTDYVFAITVIPGVVVSCVISFLLFFEPSIIYGFRGLILPADIKNPKPEANLLSGELNLSDSGETEKLQPFINDQYLSREKLADMDAVISRFLLDKKPFLVPGYTIYDFAKESGIPARRLSAYFNKVLSLTYSDFLNKYRVEFCCSKLAAGAWKNLTLEAVARESGFNNRNSFTTAFKKNTGLNPSEFIIRLKQNRQNAVIGRV